MKKVLPLFFVIIPILTYSQQTSVLFLGNSYTSANNLPQTFYNLALAGGDTILYDSNTPGGYTLEGHATNTATLTKIRDRDWDFVVIQEQSQRPSFPPAQVQSDVYPYASMLVDSIRSNSECTEPVFYMTWGRRSGDQQNCQFYPPLCTYAGMQARLRESYLEMGFEHDARVAPCGAAWSLLEQVDTLFFAGLYTGDGSHPSSWGTYFNACVFYATIFHKSPVGIAWYSNIGEADAVVLQGLAEEVVLDSLNTWNSLVNLPQADISFTTDALEVTFENNTTNAVNSFWDFGDGQQSTENSPVHTYGIPETYEVAYSVNNGCGDNDTAYFSVTVANTGIGSASIPLVSVTNSGNGIFQIQWGSEIPVELNVYDRSGRKLHSISNKEKLTDLNLSMLSQGIYLIRSRFRNGQTQTLQVVR